MGGSRPGLVGLREILTKLVGLRENFTELAQFGIKGFKDFGGSENVKNSVFPALYSHNIYFFRLRRYMLKAL